MNSAVEAQVQRMVTVPIPPQDAFALFVERFGDFKPPEHNLLSVPIAETIFEAHAGGGVIDRGIDGSECRWARVLVIDPPNRLVLSWDISPTWQIETDPDRCSEIEVRFVPAETGSTRVELEHRHLDRHGPGWESLPDSLGGDQGWPLYLARFANLVERASGG